MLDQYLKSIFETNQQIEELFKTEGYSPSTISKVQVLMEQKKEKIEAIKGAVYIKISEQTGPEELKKIAGEINKLKEEDIFDINSNNTNLSEAILTWSFSKEELKNFSAMYDVNYAMLDYVNISMNTDRYNGRTISIVGGHERDDYNLLPGLSGERDILLTRGAEELITECLTPISHRGLDDDRLSYKREYKLDEAEGIFKDLSKKMTKRNYEGINKFYQNLDAFHNMLERIKPNDTEEEFIPENSTEIYSLYEELQNLEANYFSYYKKECVSYQYFHWAKFLLQGTDLDLRNYYNYNRHEPYDEIEPNFRHCQEAISKLESTERILDAYIEDMKEHSVKGTMDKSILEYQLQHAIKEGLRLARNAKIMKGENLKIDYNEQVNPRLSPYRKAISKETLKRNTINAYIECLKEQHMIDDSVNDKEVKQYLQDKIQQYIENPPWYLNDDERTIERCEEKKMLDLYEVFEDDELYNNFSLFQDLINCSFDQPSYEHMYKSFDFGAYNKEGSTTFSNPYYVEMIDRIEVIKKLVDLTHVQNVPYYDHGMTREDMPIFESCLAKKLKAKGIGNLISKSTIYHEILGKYVDIVNDIIRANINDYDTQPLVSENSESLHDDVKSRLSGIVRDYEVLKKVQSQIKDTWQFETEFDKEHPKTDMDGNRYLTQDPPFREVFDLQSDEEHIRNLADCLDTSHNAKDDTSVSKK